MKSKRRRPKGFRTLSFDGIEYAWRVVTRDRHDEAYANTIHRFREVDVIRISPRGKSLVQVIVFIDVEEAVKPSDIRGIVDFMTETGYDPCNEPSKHVYKFSQKILRNRDEFIVESIMTS